MLRHCLACFLLAAGLLPAGAQESAAYERLFAQAREQLKTDLDAARATAAEALAAARAAGSTEQECEALHLAATAARSQTDYESALALADEGRAVARRAGDAGWEARFTMIAGITRWSMSEYPTAIAHMLDVLAYAREADDDIMLMASYGNLGILNRAIGDAEAALDYGLKSIEVLERIEDDERLAMAHNNVGTLYYEAGDYAKARTAFERSLDLKRPFGDKRSIAATLLNLGNLATAEERHEDALQLHQEALALRREVGDPRGIAQSLAQVARAYATLGRPEEARTALTECVPLTEQLDRLSLTFGVMSTLAEVEAELGHPEAAYAALRRALEAREQQLTEEVQETVLELQTKFDVEIKEREIAQLRSEQQARDAELAATAAELRRQQWQRRALGGGLVLGFIAVGALVSRYRLKRRAERRILAETEAARLQAESANALKTRLLGIASHDLKAPLGTMINLAGGLRSAPADAPPPEQVATWFETECRRLFNLVLDLVDTAALEVGRLELRRAPIAIAALVREVTTELSEAARQKDQRLTVEIDSAAAELELDLDADRLRQVLRNLLDNAFKFNAPGGAVTVRVTVDGDVTRCSVRDEGPGLSAEDQARLFEPFETLGPQPTGGEHSTGLGLSIARELVNLHGGRLTVESEPGAGATFVIELPIVSAAVV